MLDSQKDTTSLSAGYLEYRDPTIFPAYNCKDPISQGTEKMIARAMQKQAAKEGHGKRLPPSERMKMDQCKLPDDVKARRLEVMRVIRANPGLSTNDIRRHFDHDPWKDLTVMRNKKNLFSTIQGNETHWRLTPRGMRELALSEGKGRTSEEYHADRRNETRKHIVAALKQKAHQEVADIVAKTGYTETCVRNHLNDMEREGAARSTTTTVPCENTITQSRKVKLWSWRDGNE